MITIPDSHLDLLKDETKAIAYLATIMKDGSPQVTPVWFNFDGEHIYINSAEGRIKDQNMRSRPVIAITIQDPATFYRYLQLRGRVIDFSHDGADDHIDALSFKYTGKLQYEWRNRNEKRIKYKVQINKVDAH
jgi:PPOX class probable F420-dependent enzyme